MRTSHPTTTSLVVSLSFLSTSLAQTLTYVGCFSSSKPLTEASTYLYQSSSHCQSVCIADSNQAVLGLTSGNDCWCGSEIPAQSSKVSDSNCNSPCTGYGQDDCGGNDYWSVYTTGTENDVAYYGGSSASSSSSGSSTTSSASGSTGTAGTRTTTSASVITSVAPGKTVVVTESGSAAQSTSSSASSSKDSKSSGPNVAGIAAGVVVGVVAIIAIVGAIFFIRRRRSRKAEEAGFQKHSGADFLAGGRSAKIPAGPDARLDPEAMMQRRQSDGSIADNQDYSRRILKVTNPDGSHN